jgi:hypothetical protein
MKSPKLFGFFLTAALAVSSSAVFLARQDEADAQVGTLPCSQVSPTSFLAENQFLEPGQCVVSPNVLLNQDGLGQPAGYFLVLQGDGNLVLYNYANGQALWASGTNGQTVLYAVMQNDGNLVLYGTSGAVWASNTAGDPDSILEIQDDGNTVIYQPQPQGDGTYKLRAVWATGTSQ